MRHADATFAASSKLYSGLNSLTSIQSSGQSARRPVVMVRWSNVQPSFSIIQIVSGVGPGVGPGVGLGMAHLPFVGGWEFVG